jgi:hypothetical protein
LVLNKIHMNDTVSKIGATTAVLFYLFFCGGLYLISFWSTFEFDVTSYIEPFDVPKSFIFPLATGIGLSFLIMLIQGVVHSWEKLNSDEKVYKKLAPEIASLPKKKILLRILNDFHTWVFIILFACYSLYKPRRAWVFGVLGVTLIILAIAKFMRNRTVAEKIPNITARLFIGFMLFFVPIYAYTLGKLNSIEIWEGKKYYRIKTISFKDSAAQPRAFDYTKLLGKLGSSLFVTDSANSKVVVFNMDQIAYVEYTLVNHER